MNFLEAYRRKTGSLEDALSLLRDGCLLYTYGLAEPYTLLSHLEPLRDAGKRITLVDTLNPYPYPFYLDESYRDTVDSESIFFSRFCTQLQRDGRISFIPNHLRNGMWDRVLCAEREGRPFTVYAVMVSPMDNHGYFTTGIVGMSNRKMVELADLVILEVNERMPRTFGNTYIHVSEADCIFQGENHMFYREDKPAGETDRRIGAYIADLVEDGSTLQLGIGGIPNAAAEALIEKHDLGVHTEMLSDSLLRLYESGAVTNRKKTCHRDRMVTAFSYGSERLYRFLDNNPGVLHLEVEQVNEPYLIARNRKMVSVNTTLQVDLMGQCASEAIGTAQISGTGGQTETAAGAKLSPGGKSIIALHSTAMVKNAAGERERKSCIVPVHPAGTVVSLMRSDTDYVVTEYGVAALRGASLAKRARALISIAHPDYRAELTEQARNYHLI